MRRGTYAARSQVRDRLAVQEFLRGAVLAECRVEMREHQAAREEVSLLW